MLWKTVAGFMTADPDAVPEARRIPVLGRDEAVEFAVHGAEVLHAGALEPAARGGIPVRLDGKLCVLEEFRIPKTFDPASVRVFNTNVFHFDARALHDLDIPWTYFRVTKKVDDKPVIQFERLVNEVTSHLPTRYLRVPRSGVDARFLPVKDNEELAKRRGEIEQVARARGML